MTTSGAASRGLLDALLSVWPDPVAVLDRGGRILALGPAAERQLGWSTAELAGRALADVLVADEDHHRLPRRLLADDAALDRGVESRTNITLRRRDGSTFCGEIIVADLADGTAATMVAVLRPDMATHDRDIFQLIFRNAPDIISVIDEARGQVLVNDAAERLLGHNMQQLEENRTLVHPDDLERVQRELMPRDEGYGGPVRYRVRTASGEWRWLESTSTDMRSAPPVGGLLVFTRDVSAEVLADERLAASTARMVALVSGLNAGVLVEDEARLVVTANAALHTMFGIDEDPGLAGRPVAEALEALAQGLGDPGAFLDATRRTPAARTAGVQEWPMADGRTVELDTTPIDDAGEPRGFLWSFRDVTERRAAEARRERLVRLEQEARRTAERQTESLRELEQMRSQLIATVSHELRTPLTPIASHVEMLLDGYPDQLTADQRRMVEVIERNLDRLRRLVDDLLTVRRVEQGLLDIQRLPVDLPALVVAQVEQFRPFAERIHVDLTCSAGSGPAVRGDADRLGTVIDNLLANALKFTPAGGRVDVTAECDGASWSIRVADTGRGIAAGDRERVFEPFFRTTDSENEGLPGSGLGLAVARALMEGHRGTLTVESAPGRGSTFVARLPAAGPA